MEVQGRDWGVGEGELVTGAMGISWDGAEDSMFTLYEILCTERTIVTNEHRGDYVQFTYGSPSGRVRRQMAVAHVRLMDGARVMDRVAA